MTDCQTDSWASALVLIPPDPALLVGGAPLDPGDQIAVMTPDGACAGASAWDGAGTALTVWADDPMTDDVDGLREGEPVSLVVWDASENAVRSAGDVALAYDPAFDPGLGFTPDGLYILAGIEEMPAPSPPGGVTLGDAFPNPVAQRAQIPFSIDAEADVSVEVFDALGRSVGAPIVGRYGPGPHAVPFDATGLAAGVYVYRLRTGQTVLQGQLTVSR